MHANVNQKQLSSATCIESLNQLSWNQNENCSKPSCKNCTPLKTRNQTQQRPRTQKPTKPKVTKEEAGWPRARVQGKRVGRVKGSVVGAHEAHANRVQLKSFRTTNSFDKSLAIMEQSPFTKFRSSSTPLNQPLPQQTVAISSVLIQGGGAKRKRGPSNRHRTPLPPRTRAKASFGKARQLHPSLLPTTLLLIL